MLLGALATNLGLLHPDAGELRALQGAVVAVATPLLLLGADLGRVARGAGPLLPAFAAVAVGTFVGGLAGARLLAPSLGATLPGGAEEAAALAAALAAKSVGGGTNFLAVCDATGVSSFALGVGLAADNLAALVYFPANAALAGEAESGGSGGPAGRAERPARRVESRMQKVRRLAALSWRDPRALHREAGFGGEELTLALALALAIVAVVHALGAGGNTIAAATAVTVVLATAAPRVVAPLEAAGASLAQLLLGLYFASAGIAAGRASAVDPASFVAVAQLLGVLYLLHFAVCAAARRALRVSPLDAAICSNAAVGGPATASALAVAKGVDPTPGVLLGNLGNAGATFLALGMLPLFRAAMGA